MKNKEVKDLIKTTFNDVAAKYDTNEYFAKSGKLMVETINNTLKSHTKSFNILDLSSGTGNIAIELSKIYPDASIYAVDISEEMLKVAKEKTDKEGITNISYLLQDVENLDFGDVKFDIITCGYGLFFYPDMDNVLTDIFSRLTLNGKFVFSTFKKEAFQPYIKIFLDLLSQDYDIRPPETIEERLLETKNEIEQFLIPAIGIKYQINEMKIEYPMDINIWWDILNTTGYQGLLTKLENKYDEFELKYLKQLESISMNRQLDFNANSFICIVSKTESD